MAATFTVETGTGSTTANAYATVAQVDQYNEDHDGNTTYSVLSDTLKEKAIRLATQYLDNWYGSRWKGTRTNDTQALDWPRAYVVDSDGYGIDADDMPQRLKDACAEAAVISGAGTELLPDLSDDGNVKRTKVKVDVIEQEVEYSGSNSPYTQYSNIDRLLRGLLQPGGQVRRA